VTPEGNYPNSGTGPAKVWPVENMLDIDLTVLTNVKKNRNKQKSLGLTGYAQLYSEYDVNRPANKISVMGNPSLGEVFLHFAVCLFQVL
jgi:cell surface protein SprA